MRKPAEGKAVGAGDGPTHKPDGRSGRSRRTRQAVIDALLTLIAEGDPNPGAHRVAEHAEVSTRTVFAHFTSLDDLHCASVEQATARVLSLLSPIDLDQPLGGRIDELCRQRARVNEEIGPITRAAALRAPASVPLARAVERGRRASREQIDRIFAVELARLDEPARRRRRATLDALVGPYAWDLLRSTHGLPPDEARLAVREALHALLPPSASPADPDLALAATSTAPSAPDGRADDRSRAHATDDAVAEIDQRIERLVAAIETGTPADLVAPRLRELKAARAALVNYEPR
jgi:TetR/AcrR family transcriptional regulator, regulator of autoinduction and epiphytic fitness